MQYVCIDIGGTAIKYGLMDGENGLKMTGELPTEAQKSGGAGIMRKVERLVESFLPHRPAGICISTAGMVDSEKGCITYAAPLIPQYTGTEIKPMLERRFSIPCEVENDVRCAALAEHRSGAAQGTQSSVCLTVGTGIGGAVVLHGKVLHGKVLHGFSGSAGEIGYLKLPHGDFQDLASTGALVGAVAREKGIAPDVIDGKWVFAQAQQGDEICRRAIDRLADTLGMGIANLCYVLNPEVVVVGGGIMAQREYLYPRLRQSMERYLLPAVAAHTRLAFAVHQNHAGLYGAYYHFCSKHTAES